MVQKVNSTNTFGVAKFVVSSDATQGTHTTIQAAINDATTGDSILVRAGSYNENLTLKAGVTLFTGLAQATQNIGQGGVILTQGCTLPLTGSCIFQGFYFSFGATNNMFLDQASGASSLWMFNCGFNFSAGNTVFKCDNGQTNIRLYNCIGTGTSQMFSIASGGTFQCFNCNIQAPGNTPTASAAPSGSTVFYFNSLIGFPTNLTDATFQALNSFFYTSSSTFPGGTFNNNTLITTATSGTYEFKNCQFNSGSASAISVGSGTTVKLSGACDVNSSNTNAITGSGTLIASGVNFSGTSNFVNVTTQTVGAVQGWKGSAVASGMIGEQVRSTVSVASAITFTTGVPVNVTSISLTAGIWDVSAIGGYANAAITGNNFAYAISTASATLGTEGDSMVQSPYPPTANSPLSISLASYRLTLTSTTTVYLVGYGQFSAGTLKGYGRISATRVG